MMMLYSVQADVQNSDVRQQPGQRCHNCEVCWWAGAAVLAGSYGASIRPPICPIITQTIPVKLYHGEPGGMVYVVSSIAGQLWSHPLRHVDVRSPSLFAWGYEGSGPTDLAMSLLCDALSDWPDHVRLRNGWFKAAPFYQAFKTEYVSRWQLGKPFGISAERVVSWLRRRGANMTERSCCEHPNRYQR